ncbi:hypothetical protein PQR68_34590 [Paraburkholderia agricolaris]|uniref:hypothetical protein n=1 Tax=Paraburkholderia agricolaris TaxID=2152888 RepID=UPI0038BBD9F9
MGIEKTGTDSMTSVAGATHRRIRRRPFPAPVSRASLRRAVLGNPDLPASFIADTPAAMAEACARAPIAVDEIRSL